MESSWNTILQTLEGHTSVVNSVAFSHDSKLLASASWDHTVRVWDAAIGSCHQTVLVNTSISSLSFNSTNTSLVTNIGLIKVDRTGLPLTLESSQSGRSKGNRQGLGISRSWVAWNDQNIVWLPPDYRPRVSDISPSGSTVAIGCESGKVIMVGFSLAILRNS